jgi:hypothetical protein
MAKCPICNVDLEIDDTYDIHYDTDFTMTLTLNQLGHCPKCDRDYQWDECYDLTNKLVEGLREV